MGAARVEKSAQQDARDQISTDVLYGEQNRREPDQ